MKKLFLFAIVVLGFTAASFGQTNNVNANSSVTIITPITISNSRGLDFGTVAKGVGTGTVTIAPVELGTRSGIGVTLSSINGGTSAKFLVSGEANHHFTVTLPGSATVTDGTNTLTISSFLSTPSGTNGDLGTGSCDLFVGATITIPATTLAAQFNGTFNVSVDYN